MTEEDGLNALGTVFVLLFIGVAGFMAVVLFILPGYTMLTCEGVTAFPDWCMPLEEVESEVVPVLEEHDGELSMAQLEALTDLPPDLIRNGGRDSTAYYCWNERWNSYCALKGGSSG